MLLVLVLLQLLVSVTLEVAVLASELQRAGVDALVCGDVGLFGEEFLNSGRMLFS